MTENTQEKLEQIKAQYQRVTSTHQAEQQDKITQSSRQQEAQILCKAIADKFVNGELGLRDRQEDSLIKLADSQSPTGYFHACTAFGKTYLMMAIAESYNSAEKNKKIIILEENQTVLEQVKQDFIEKSSLSSENIGAFYGKEKSPNSGVIVATYASMEKLVDEVGAENIGLVLCDEAHHILSENRQRVAQQFNNSLLYGFTATPDYDEDKNCEQVFDNAIDVITLQEGVEKGLLCSCKNGLLVSKTPVDLTSAINNTGDYDAEKLEEIFKASHINGMREELADYYLTGSDEYLGNLKGKTTIINAPNQNEANRLAEIFNQKAGQTIAKAYHTNTSTEVLEEFNQGEFPVLIQVNRVTEGYSNPKVELCINYPTGSRVRAAQRSGRALRSDIDNPHKKALIIDIAFKKSNEKSTLEEIRANRQVLFQDIAQDITLFSSDFRKHHDEVISHRNHDISEKSSINTSQLFDIVTSYEDLYTLACEKLIKEEQSTYDAERHLKNTDFYQGDWALIKDGSKVSSKQYQEINAIFAFAYEENPDLVYKGDYGGHDIYFFDKSRISDVLALQAFAGCKMTPLNELYAVEYDKEHHIKASDFYGGNWALIKEGRKMSASYYKEINAMFATAYAENPDLVYKSKYGGKDIYFFDKSRIPDVLALQAFTGCEMKMLNELYAVEYDKEHHIKASDFYLSDWALIKNGKKIAHKKYQEINAMFASAYEENPNLIYKGKNGSQYVYFFDKSRVSEVLALQAFAGCEIIQLNELYSMEYDEEHHIKTSDFGQKNIWTLIKDGRKMSTNEYKEIKDMFVSAHAENPDLVYKGKNSGKDIYFFDKSRMSEVLALQAFTGCKMTPLSEFVGEYDKEHHIKHTEFYQGNWALIKNDKKIANSQYQEINAMFASAYEENPNLVYKGRNGSRDIYFFDKSRREDVLKLKAFTGCEMQSPQEKISNLINQSRQASTEEEKKKLFKAARVLFNKTHQKEADKDKAFDLYIKKIISTQHGD